jgi:uncharacterized metal-binding protein
LVAVVDVGVVGGVLVVVVVVTVVVVELVVVTVVVVVVVVCNLEISGRNVSNYVNKKEKIYIILYLFLVGGTHSVCPQAHAIGRSCGSSDENYVRPCRGSILRGRCRYILFQRSVQCRPFRC